MVLVTCLEAPWSDDYCNRSSNVAYTNVFRERLSLFCVQELGERVQSMARHIVVLKTKTDV